MNIRLSDKTKLTTNGHNYIVCNFTHKYPGDNFSNCPSKLEIYKIIIIEPARHDFSSQPDSTLLVILASLYHSYSHANIAISGLVSLK